MVKDSKTGALRSLGDVSDLIRLFPKIQKEIQLDFKMVMNMDSSNMTSAHWTAMAEAVYAAYHHYDGFVIAQGTDTMAYSASALSFVLQNLSKPVVMTGSLIPLSELGADGQNNLIYACLTAALDIAEVCIVFANRIIRGNRAKKRHESFVDVFHSPNFPYLGEVGRPMVLHEWRKKRRKRVLQYAPHFDENIALFKLFPGFQESMIDIALERGVHGIVLEGFGPGNVPFLDHSLIPKIEKATDMGVPVVIGTQLERGVANLHAYEGGYNALKVGAISAHDMTTEAVVAKLMWALGQEDLDGCQSARAVVQENNGVDVHNNVHIGGAHANRANVRSRLHARFAAERVSCVKKVMEEDLAGELEM